MIQHGQLVEQILDGLATLQVPHGYFQHFYIASVLSSVFWGVQLFAKESLLQVICQSGEAAASGKSMTMDQIILTWSLLSVQGLRRLIESSLLAKNSASKIWFAHWMLGIAFYLAFGVAIWIEGAGTFICNFFFDVRPLTVHHLQAHCCQRDPSFPGSHYLHHRLGQ